MTAEIASEEVMARNSGSLVSQEACHRFQRSINEHDPSVLAEDHDANRHLIEDLLEAEGKFAKPFDVESSLHR